ncbi:MAG: efflux RND transporter periplasmic adaptor subunit [Lentisphaeria bacterium]|nr:efflux RND transporter periplasmic adaptor subunit [Lentisphaeria bacterium]
MNGSYARGLAAAILAAGVLCTPGCGKTKTKKTGEREVRVTVEPLTKRMFRRTIPVQGTVTPVEHAVISAKIGGTLEMLKVDEGDQRAKGELLFGIDSQVLKNQLTVREDEIKVKNAEYESAKIAEQSAAISLLKAELDYGRFLRLWQSRATSQAEFETYETSFKKAKMDVQSAKAAVLNAHAQLKQAESNLVIAKKNLDDSVIVAPFDCTVTDKYVEENEYVTVGQNILKLENQKLLEVECFISAIHYRSIEPGKTPVLFSRGRRAVVTYKAPSIDPESRTFKIKIRLPEKIRMVSGTLCSLLLVLEEREGYGLPADAILLRANDRHIAYTVDAKSNARSVEIKRGIIDGKFCEVTNAEALLKERFVVTGQTFVNNGAHLRVVTPEK